MDLKSAKFLITKGLVSERIISAKRSGFGL